MHVGRAAGKGSLFLSGFAASVYHRGVIVNIHTVVIQPEISSWSFIMCWTVPPFLLAVSANMPASRLWPTPLHHPDTVLGKFKNKTFSPLVVLGFTFLLLKLKPELFLPSH